ncbi:MAG: DMT family transporter [Desulfurococcales archaeon]|nr:DMT family transporter [Desulfurococcales archaeon]
MGRLVGASRGLAVAYAVLAAVLWGTLGVVYRWGEALGASGEWMAAGRPLVPALVAVGLWLSGRGGPSRWSLAVGVILGVFVPVYLWAVRAAGAAVASILLYTAPVWVALASGLAGDRAGVGGLALAGLGSVGAALVAAGEGLGGPGGVGALLGLLSGLLYAAYILAARAAARRGASPVEVGVHSQPVAAVVALALLKPGRPPGVLDAALMLYTGVATMLVPYTLNAMALRAMEAHRVATISLVEPLTATILAWMLLGESLSPAQILGAALVLASAALAARAG